MHTYIATLEATGQIRFYGVTGFPMKTFRYILENAEIDTMLSYCHYSLNNTTLLDLLPLVKEKNVGLMSASPLSMGLLSKKGVPFWHPADEEIKELASKAIRFCEERGENLEKLALQFSVQNEQIPVTLVGSTNPKNIRRNIAWIEEPINDDLLKQVQEILKPIHNRCWSSGRPENDDI
nr:aldo/keto reductase [Paenibacillus alginolyticus]